MIQFYSNNSIFEKYERRGKNDKSDNDRHPVVVPVVLCAINNFLQNSRKNYCVEHLKYFCEQIFFMVKYSCTFIGQAKQ